MSTKYNVVVIRKIELLPDGPYGLSVGASVGTPVVHEGGTE